jgi:hypothetical protein
MRKKLMLLAAGALTALAFAALPAGASAQEMEAHCSAAPCVGVVEGTGHATLRDDSGFGSITCKKTTGTVTQAVATSTTVSVVLTFDECEETIFHTECNNEGATKKTIVTNTITGHLITRVTNDITTAGILLTGVNTSFECPGISAKKAVTGNIIGTFETDEGSSMCGKATTHHTIDFTETGAGQQTDKVYTGTSFDLLSNNTTASQTGTAHIKYEGGKTVTITC